MAAFAVLGGIVETHDVSKAAIGVGIPGTAAGLVELGYDSFPHPPCEQRMVVAG